jgi:dTDP-4-amino-4,6-dideoxygalactose transaminase
MATAPASTRHPLSAPAAVPATAPTPGLLRFQRPILPTLREVDPYFAMAEQIRWYSNGGPCYEQLSRRIERYLGPGIHAVPVANCTLGIMAVLDQVAHRTALRSHADLVGRRAHPHGPQLVITPSYTFAAAASAIIWSGLTPLLVDVDPETWQLAPEALERALDTHRGQVAAVLATASFGCAAPPEVTDAWQDACDRHGVPMIIDAAAGFGARNGAGRLVGGRGRAEVFSFHATKPFAIGEGGVITTTDPELGARLVQVINFGFDRHRRVSLPGGMNAKLDELHAAVGLAVLDGYEEVLSARRTAAKIIVEGLRPLGYRFQPDCEGATWQHVPAQVPSDLDRDRLVADLLTGGVEARAYYDVPLHAQPAYAAVPRSGTLEVTDRLAAGALSLPMANDLSEQDVERIVEVVRAGTPR